MSSLDCVMELHTLSHLSLAEVPVKALQSALEVEKGGNFRHRNWAFEFPCEEENMEDDQQPDYLSPGSYERSGYRGYEGSTITNLEK
jgi:hypothetical protein